MAINWNQLLQTLNSGLQFGSQLLPRQSNNSLNVGGLSIPNNLLGAGLLGAGLLSDKEPGEVTQARSFLRNQFTSPVATSQLQGQAVTGAQTALQPLLGQVGPSGPGQDYLTKLFQDPTGLTQNLAATTSAASQSFQPLLDQQRQRGIADIQQKFAAAFPTVGAQGSEFNTLSRYITDEALPREQAFLGQLGLDLQGRQQNAAGSVFQDEATRRGQVLGMANRGIDIPLDAAGQILNTSKPDPLAQLASLIGSNMLFNGGQGGAGGLPGMGTGQPGQGAGQGIMDQLGGVLGSPTQLGQLNPVQLAQQLISSGDLSSLGQLLSSGALAGTPFPVGIQAGTPAGQLVQQAINAGLVESPAAQAVGPGATAGGFQGLLGAPGFGSAGAVASGAVTAVGSGYLGYQVGKKMGDWIESPGSSATGVKTALGGGAGGAAAGAAFGAVIGDGPGAVIGAIVGGLAGAFGGGSAERRREDAQKSQEQAQTDAARPAILQAGQQAIAQVDTMAPQLESLASTYKPFMQQLIASGDPQALALDKQIDLTLKSITGSYRGGTGATILDILTDAATGMRSVKDNLTSSAGGKDALTAYLNSGETGIFGPGTEVAKAKIAQAQQLAQLAQQALDFARSKGFPG